MKVRRETISDSILDRLIVTDPAGSDHHPGDQVGFYCPGCGAADETARELWHEDGCSHLGRHGRQHYEDFNPDVMSQPSPEFDPSNKLTVIRSGETEGRGGLCEGEILAFECACGNLDDEVFEVVHDEPCPLAGRHGLTEPAWLSDSPVMRADGGD